MTGSTLSGNSAGRDGGGMFTRLSDFSLTNTTVTDNSASGVAGGIRAYTNDGATLNNSIVAGNTDSGTAPDLLATAFSDLIVENSLNGDTTGSGIADSTGAGNILNQPALLGPLANNGGPTQDARLVGGQSRDRRCSASC